MGQESMGVATVDSKSYHRDMLDGHTTSLDTAASTLNGVVVASTYEMALVFRKPKKNGRQMNRLPSVSQEAC